VAAFPSVKKAWAFPAQALRRGMERPDGVDLVGLKRDDVDASGKEFPCRFF